MRKNKFINVHRFTSNLHGVNLAFGKPPIGNALNATVFEVSVETISFDLVSPNPNC